MLSGNIGEWSEVYALFKLLADKKIHAGDVNFNKLENIFYPIVKIIRKEVENEYEYKFANNLVLVSGNGSQFRISIEKFREYAEILLEIMKDSTGSFSAPEIEIFMNTFDCITLKSGSSDKTDLHVVIHDKFTLTQQTLGFSIKSQLGSASTLMNASGVTNFRFKIQRCLFSDAKINQINSIEGRDKVRNRLARIKEEGGRIIFDSIENEVFRNNLILIDSSLPEILSNTLMEYYCNGLNPLSEIVKKLNTTNPLNYSLVSGHLHYDYKLKRFLSDIALGMMPSVVWNGILEANGGYIIVKEDGELLCYHIYNRNLFENYLIHNTKLETPSTSRHNFGKIFKENGEIFIRLNMQIRFIK